MPGEPAKPPQPPAQPQVTGRSAAAVLGAPVEAAARDIPLSAKLLAKRSNRKCWSKYPYSDHVQAIRGLVFPPLPISQTYRARLKAACHTDRKSTRLNSSHANISYA